MPLCNSLSQETLTEIEFQGFEKPRLRCWDFSDASWYAGETDGETVVILADIQS